MVVHHTDTIQKSRLSKDCFCHQVESEKNNAERVVEYNLRYNTESIPLPCYNMLQTAPGGRGPDINMEHLY